MQENFKFSILEENKLSSSNNQVVSSQLLIFINLKKMSSVGNKKTTKNMYVVSRYFKNGKNVSKISFSFKVDRKGFFSWVAKECSIRVIKIKKRKCDKGLTAKFAEMEKHLV